MSLHLIFSLSGLKACQHRQRSGDKFVLLGDGVYAHQQALQAGIEPINLYLLAPDAEARGIGRPCTEALSHIGYPDFVELTLQCSPIVSWKE